MSLDSDKRYERFDQLMERNMMFVRRMCWDFSWGKKSLCEDYIQECYIAIWNNLHSLREDASPFEEKKWVYWRCRSVISHLRRKKPLEVPFDNFDADLLPMLPDSPNHELIEELSVTLTPQERYILFLMLSGYSDKEIADTLHVKPDTVRIRCYRMLKKMKQVNELLNSKQHTK